MKNKLSKTFTTKSVNNDFENGSAINFEKVDGSDEIVRATVVREGREYVIDVVAISEQEVYNLWDNEKYQVETCH